MTLPWSHSELPRQTLAVERVVAYDRPRDGWPKPDVVTEVAYEKLIHALRTTLAAGCLGNRQRCGPVIVPSAELVTAQTSDLGGAA